VKASIEININHMGEEQHVDIDKDGNFIFITYFLDDGRGPKHINPFAYI
jgi:hypothetical protein